VGTISLWRVYDHEPRGAGAAFLVERLWPRGVRKDALELTAWVKEAAPSRELRVWFSHVPERWAEFRRRYFAELDTRPEACQPLRDALAHGDVILLYSARDRDRNSAVALRDYLLIPK
jgi:uncharacterized protein YeaO (DUF488 family)